jgi:hypothetical protein
MDVIGLPVCPGQPGLKGIDLGNFLIKRVVHLLRQEMPEVQVCTSKLYG